MGISLARPHHTYTTTVTVRSAPMLHKPDTVAQPSEWSIQSQLIHDGLERSSFGETAEAMYLTSGYVYESAEQAEARKSKAKAKTERKEKAKQDKDQMARELDAQEEKK